MVTSDISYYNRPLAGLTRESGMNRFDGIFIDFYGTLVGGDGQAVCDICQAVIDDHRITDLTAEKLAEMWGHAYFAGIEALDGDGFRLLTEIERDTLIDTVEPLLGPIDPEPYIARLNGFLARPLLFEEVPEVLERVDLPVCIVSNADEDQLKPALAHHGLEVEHVVTSERARSYKPEPGIFEYAMNLTGWSPERVIHIGDSLHSDVGGAQRLGLTTAWIRRHGRISDIGQATPDHTWSDLRPLPEFLARG